MSIALLIPDYCFRVVCQSPGKPNRVCSANGILIDREEGWFCVNEHFVSAGSEHFVVIHPSGKEHRLVMHTRLINARADVALLSIKDTSAIPQVTLPHFGCLQDDNELHLVGRQQPDDRNIRARFLQYPVNARHLDFKLGGYGGSIMFGMRGKNTDNINGLSGSPLLNSKNEIVGVLTQSKLFIGIATPAHEITRLLCKAKCASPFDLVRSLFR